MPIVPVASFVRVTVVSQLQGQQLENTFTYKSETPCSIADVVPIASAMYDYWHDTVLTGWSAVLADRIHFTELWTQLFTPTQAYVKQVATFDIQGASGDLCLPAEVSLVLTKLSDYAGKKNRGRIYLPGVTNAMMNATSGLWDPTAIATLRTVWIAACTHAVVTTGVIKTYDPCVTPANMGNFTLLTGGGYNTAPRVQRRRQIGRGI